MIHIFHPIVATWFSRKFGQPSPPQAQAWPHIAAGESVLLAAPTGSGKTMAAFLVCIDRLVRLAIDGNLAAGVHIVYVSPLRALSNDIHRNLEEPLAEIREIAKEFGVELPEIRSLVRTGDSTASERAAVIRNPPHILVTTPESLYLLLTAQKGRLILSSAKSVIVDEIHALARDKRGTHLMLSLERLDELCGHQLQRIGLSATQRPLDQIANFLVGVDQMRQPRHCVVVDAGMSRDLDLAQITPASELSAVCSHEQWDEIYGLLVEQINAHKSSVIFVNTRRLAERISFRLSEALGESVIACHHGSMSKAQRHQAEQKLKRGELRAIVATASLELGIDIGFIELVCQIGSPRNIAAFLQRVGRSGHSLGLTPKGRLFPLTRDELVEGMALIRSIRHGVLDAIIIPEAPADILIQQIIASVASRDWTESELYSCLGHAWPYRNLSQEEFRKHLTIAAEGAAKSRRTGAYVYWDRINGTVKPRRSARLAALTSGGAIPDLAEYRVVTSDGTFVGTLDEEFSIESSPGDVFLLGSNSWMIEYVRAGQVVVHDAGGAPPSVPFWQGEAPGRSFELSAEVSSLRKEINSRLNHAVVESKAELGQPILPEDERRVIQSAVIWLEAEVNASRHQAEQAARYIAAQMAATGAIPTDDQIVFERFFDETGGMQLVVHAPFGARITKAWGLAMRKRYCRRFDFELQATADDNGFVLAMGPQDGFPLESMFGMINSKNARALLEQALLQIPTFGVRWRWNIARALSVLRMNAGKRVPPHLQRFRAEDMLTAVFPQSTQCFEHVTGDIEFPDHPLIQQTLHDCLTEALDIDRLEMIMGRIERGEIKMYACDTREPSPFSYGLLNSGPYAFLDDAPLEDRRARAISSRRSFSIESVRDLGILDGQAIAVVREEARPTPRDVDELHDLLMQTLGLIAAEFSEYAELMQQLVDARRAVRFHVGDGVEIWAAMESWPAVRQIWPSASLPDCHLPAHLNTATEVDVAMKALLRGRLEFSGPQSSQQLANDLGLPDESVSSALPILESEGSILSGRFSPGSDALEWCDRRILARIHRLTVEGLRQKIKAVDASVFYRFLVDFQHAGISTKLESVDGLAGIIEQLQGWEVPVGAWENELIALRTKNYQESMLDQLCYSGRVGWGRLRCEASKSGDEASALRDKNWVLHRAISMGIFLRADRKWIAGQGPINFEQLECGREAARILEVLRQSGAVFYEDLQRKSGLLRSQVDEGLRELVSRGIVVSDGFEGVRHLAHAPTGGSNRPSTLMPGGRWSLVNDEAVDIHSPAHIEFWAWQLLKRYGVVFRDLLVREDLAPNWGLIARFYRRLEAQGQVRGGRFVAGVSGEQFALPEVVDRLRKLRDAPDDSTWYVISAVDPLNLVGILTKDEKIPAVRRNKLVIRNGRLLARLVDGELRFVQEVELGFSEVIRRAVSLNGLVRQRDPFSQSNMLSRDEVGSKEDRIDRRQKLFRRLELIRNHDA